jgi:beta-mannosidase
MFQYFWSDPWPCLFGSGLLDYYREEYKAYGIYRLVYTPVLASVEWIKDRHIVGFPKTYRRGDSLEAQLWVTNDLPRSFEGATLRWDLLGPGGAAISSSSRAIEIEADSSRVVERVFRGLSEDEPGAYRMRLLLQDRGGEKLSENYFDYEVLGS